VTAFAPRWYQTGTVEAVMEYVAERDGSPCVVLPTAAGKSPAMAMFIQHVQQNWPGSRIIVLAHVKELIQQNHDKMKEVWPEVDAGIYSAGLNRRDTTNAVIFASIQSVKNRALELGNFDFVIIDEAHRIPPGGDGAYLTFIRAVKKNNPHCRAFGLTATPYRLQGGEVCGPKRVLTEIVYDVGVKRLIDEGYLCRPVVKGGEQRVDLSKIAKSNGDYNASALDEAMSAELLVGQTIDEFMRLAADRNAWILFGSGEKHIRAMQDAFANRHGIHLPIVTGKTPRAERDRTIVEFKAGKHRGILNINVLSEGFDAPFIDCVGMFRPTKSPGLYYQQVGRGFRLHSSKKDFLVLDFADNVLEHGPIDQLKPPRQGGKGAAPQRKCPECQSYCPAGAKDCAECGFVFPEAGERDLEVRHHTTANGVDILSGGDGAQWNDVDEWALSLHSKPGKPPSMRVTYHVGLAQANEWVLLEHGSMARARAVQWWTERGGAKPAPRTVDEALQRKQEIQRPKQICANWAGRYPEIIGHRN
jgi:DNA repair protein RadD